MFVRKYFLQAFGLALCLPGSFVSSLSAPKPAQSGGLYPSTLIHEFPNPTWLENIAVRRNGQLLVTSISTAALVQVDPFGKLEPIPVAQVPDATGILGIAELEQDVFYVVSGNLSAITNDALTFPSAVWKIDVRPFRTTKKGRVSRRAEIALVANLDDVLFANTACRLSPDDNSTLLISDSATGRVIKLDVNTGASVTAIQESNMAPSANGAGVAGIHMYKSDLYYTNFGAETLYKIPVSLNDGTPTGPPVAVYSGATGDDFTLSRDGKTAWIATNRGNTLVQVDISGRTGRVVARGLNMTSAALGRTSRDRNSLYVVSGGGLDIPLDKPGVTGGRVVRVDVPGKTPC